MFGISLYELVVILIIAILILNPKDFVFLVSKASQFVKFIKSLFSKVQNEIQDINILSHFDDYNIVNKDSKIPKPNQHSHEEESQRDKSQRDKSRRDKSRRDKSRRIRKNNSNISILNIDKDNINDGIHSSLNKKKIKTNSNKEQNKKQYMLDNIKQQDKNKSQPKSLPEKSSLKKKAPQSSIKYKRIPQKEVSVKESDENK